MTDKRPAKVRLEVLMNIVKERDIYFLSHKKAKTALCFVLLRDILFKMSISESEYVIS